MPEVTRDHCENGSEQKFPYFWQEGRRVCFGLLQGWDAAIVGAEQLAAAQKAFTERTGE